MEFGQIRALQNRRLPLWGPLFLVLLTISHGFHPHISWSYCRWSISSMLLMQTMWNDWKLQNKWVSKLWVEMFLSIMNLRLTFSINWLKHVISLTLHIMTTPSVPTLLPVFLLSDGSPFLPKLAKWIHTDDTVQCWDHCCNDTICQSFWFRFCLSAAYCIMWS